VKTKQIKVGDCYLIPLPDGRNAYGQYIFWDERYGPLSRIFAAITSEPMPLEDVPTDKLMFSPVYIGFGSVFKDHRWRVGSLPIPKFEFPKFRFSFGLQPGEYHDWKIYDGKDIKPVGNLPPQYRALEFLCGWSPQAIEQRIMTGVDPHANLL
jgi:hypothetical protein